VLTDLDSKNRSAGAGFQRGINASFLKTVLVELLSTGSDAMSDFFVLAILYAKEGREDELRTNLIAVVEPSRKEEGSLRYELFVQQDDPRRFVFAEHWADTDAQQKHHTKSEHIRRFQENGAAAVEKVELYYKLDRIA
jgi:quinol monooxygenase YgiN